MKIPYGISDFSVIRKEGYFYADKTPFLPELEAYYRFAIFLRPPRFGKSTLVSMLEHYYDIGRRSQFDELFRRLWVHEHPTAEQGRYLVLTFDFSGVTADAGVDVLHRSFVEAVRAQLRTFLMRYCDRAPELGYLSADLDRYSDAGTLVSAVLGVVSATPHKVYVLIDEYDQFARRLLLAGESTDEAMMKKTGFVRTFYAALKAATHMGAVQRVFITGVTPLMLDDLSSGFNIATHASMCARLSGLAGFMRADTERALDELLTARPGLAERAGLKGRSELLDVLEKHHNGYRFSEKTVERIYNPYMVLYFLREFDVHQRLPSNILDQNVRTEYAHLQEIGTLGGIAAGERRELLETIAGEGHIRSSIVERFGVESLSPRTHFISLLYFLGMLTLGPSPPSLQVYDLVVPDRVIRELQWEHLALMMKKEANVAININERSDALAAMAERGEIAGFLDVFQRQVLQAFSNRDLMGLSEKTIKLLLMTYASLGRVFYPLSEAEFAQGYGDLFLSASRMVSSAKFSWLLELKYLKAGAKSAQIEAAFAEAAAQVARYASDEALLPVLVGDRSLKAGMLVFVGAKKVLFRPWEREPEEAERKRGKKTRSQARN